MALQDWLTALKTPVEAGLSTKDMQKEYNQRRNQVQGAWGAGAETLKGQLGERGFRVGESGQADTALGQMYSQGSQSLAQSSTDIYLDEAKRRMQLAELNQNRMLGAGGLEAQWAQIQAQNAASAAASGNAADRLAWEKDQWKQEFDWQKESQALSGLSGMWGSMGESQQEVYAPWWESVSSWQ